MRKPPERLDLTPAAKADNPLTVLPSPEWHAPVTRFLAARGYLVKDHLGFCVTMLALQRDYGLTIDDARTLLTKLASPEIAADQKGDWDLMADLNRLAANLIARRRRREDSARYLRAAQDPGGAAAEAADVARRFTDWRPTE